MKSFTFLLVFLCACSVLGATHYVSTTGSNISPYSSWTDAATNIQDAVNVATNGSTVLVTNGSYEGFITVTNGITLKSANGYAVTFINGQYCNPDLLDPCEHSNSCITLTHPDIVFDGFTVQNHDISGTPIPFVIKGMAIHCIGGTVRNSRIRGNSAYNCTGEEPWTRVYGGGIYCENALIEDCIIETNGNWGCLGYGEPGGGIYCTATSRVERCIIRENVGNEAIYCSDSSLVRNCLIYSNYVFAGSGLGVWCSADSKVESCTIYGNDAGIECESGAEVVNSIITSNHNGNCIGDLSGFSYCCATSALPGEGNVQYNPMFEDATNGNFRLKHYSPLVNRGLNQSWMTNATDLDGNARISMNTVEIGAYETPGAFLAQDPVYVSPGGSHTIPYDSWANAATDIYQGVYAAGVDNTVFVTNGFYTPSQGIEIFQGTKVTSINGADDTWIGYSSITMYDGASMEGLTLTNMAVTALATNLIEDCKFFNPGRLSGGHYKKCYVERIDDHMSLSYAFIENSIIKDPYMYTFFESTAHNCTVVNLRKMGKAPSIDGDFINCIIYGTYNSAGNSTTNCWISDTNSIIFVDYGNGDYRLITNSPCIDAGTDLPGITEDYAGTPRPLDGNNDGTNTLDIGAFEFISETADSDNDGLADRAEDTLGTGLLNSDSDNDQLSDGDEMTQNTDPLDPDSDQDGAQDGQEVAAGTSPTNATSMFGIQIALSQTNGFQLQWSTVSNRGYIVERTTNLFNGVWTSVVQSAIYENDPGREGSEFLLDTNQTADTKIYYRIKIEP